MMQGCPTEECRQHTDSVRQSCGRSIVEAIIARYSDINCAPECDLPIDFHFAKGSPRKNAHGYVIAAASMSLDHEDIVRVGSKHYLTIACNKVKYADLSRNRMSQWQSVLDLLDVLPSASKLDISYNCFSEPPEKMQWPRRPPRALAFQRLASMHMNGLGLMTMEVVEKLLKLLPALKELSLAVNNIRRIELGDGFRHNRLESLNLAQNYISSPCEVHNIDTAFPNIQVLTLSHNPINRLLITDVPVHSSPGTRGDKHFSQLKMLYMQHCFVDMATDFFDCLRQLGHLQCLYFSNNPITQVIPAHIRRSVLSVFLPNRLALNGSPTSEKEYETNIPIFLEFYASRPDKPRRYFELIEKTGKDLQTPLVSTSALTLISIRVHGSRFKLRLSQDTSLARLRLLLSEVLDWQPDTFLLRHVVPRRTATPGASRRVQLNNEHRSLHSSGIESGDIVMVCRRTQLRDSDLASSGRRRRCRQRKTCLTSIQVRK